MDRRATSRGLLRATVPFGLVIVVCFAACVLWVIDRKSELRARQAGRGEVCDRLFTALMDETHAELGTALGSRTDGTCHEPEVGGSVRCLVSRHADEDNPRNRALGAYTTGPIHSCQVLVEPVGPRAIRFSQVREIGAATRTFSIRPE